MDVTGFPEGQSSFYGRHGHYSCWYGLVSAGVGPVALLWLLMHCIRTSRSGCDYSMFFFTVDRTCCALNGIIPCAKGGREWRGSKWRYRDISVCTISRALGKTALAQIA